jgi:hypothetical protein
VNPVFYIHKRHSAGNLHISVSGEFNGQCAWELFKTIWRQGQRAGRVFVDTAGLHTISEESVSLFKSHLKPKRMRPDWLYFKGRKGFQIALDGSRVLIINKCGKDNAPQPDNQRPSISADSSKYSTQFQK